MDLLQFKQIQTRRDFFKWCAGGIGGRAGRNERHRECEDERKTAGGGVVHDSSRQQPASFQTR